jgi:hypothetical protein
MTGELFWMVNDLDGLGEERRRKGRDEKRREMKNL